ncbi:MAG: O-methyltransferase [Actinomycetota bacterium]
MDILNPAVERYLGSLATTDDEAVLIEMEGYAKEHGFPIVGRLCGRFLEVMARTINAKRIFEMGSGYGYSAYWFSRATGPEGEIHLTDMDPENEKMALGYLGRAKLDGPINYHVASAIDAFNETSGDFDIVYCDIDKHEYPQAFELARSRVRVGGLYMCDNMLWSGRVTGEEPDDSNPELTRTIDEANKLIAADPDYRSFILPIRDGVVCAVRVR